jgi:hypothetical protein
MINFQAAWISIMLGLLTGVVQGLFFHKEGWLGGYNSWERRMLRLGHVSFFGVAFLNIAFVVSAAYLHLGDSDIWWSSRLLLLGQVTMPVVCYLTAVRKSFRHLFFVPVLSLVGGTGVFLCEVLR